jgi:acyl-CoA dehydrogenase
MTIIWILLVIAVYSVLLYHRASLLQHTGAALVILVSLMLWYDVSSVLFKIILLVFFLAAVPLNVPPLRRKVISGYLLDMYRKEMPSISKTEEEAIEAGTVWWDGELFSGDPDWKKLLLLPAPMLSRRESEFLDGPVEKLCRMLDDWEITQELQDLPEEVWDFLKANGFFGMIIPQKYDGLEFSAQAHSAVIMKIASRSMSAAVTAMVPNSLGPAELLLRYGTDEQRDYYLPRLARGEEIPCFALTGPDAGSDAASIPDNGVVCRREFNGEKDVLGIRLNWDKRYITLGPVATLIGLAFRLYDPDRLLGEDEDIGVTLALIPADVPGITIGERHFPLDAAFQVGPNQGKDVFIPVDWIIGGRELAGKGWGMLMDCLAEGRSISLPATSTASSKLASRFVGAYARIRKQFNMPIGRFEGVEEALARIAGYTYLIDSARAMTAVGVDQGEEPAVVSAIVKYNLTELARSVLNDAMDIQGGAGICLGPRNLMGRIYQSVPVGITVEGANILTRNMIIFGQGAIRCHPYILREINAAGDENRERGLLEFDRAVFGHAGFIISNVVRTFLLGISGAHIAKAAGSFNSQMYIRQLTRMSSGFALVSDITMLLLGGSLKRKERLSARLADALSYMYLASAAVKRFEDKGAHSTELPLLQWSCRFSLFKVQESFYGLFENYPNKIIALLMKWIVFPFGKPFKHPSDKLDHSAADILLNISNARDRLTEGIFIPGDTDEPLGRIEDALPKIIAAESIEKKIQKAVKDGLIKKGFQGQELEAALSAGIINEKEASLERTFIEIRKEIVRVDDFPKDRWRRDLKKNDE